MRGKVFYGLILATTCAIAQTSEEVITPIAYPKPVLKTEFNLQLGVIDYKRLDTSGFVRVGIDYRIKYPNLLGAGVFFSSSSDVDITTSEIRAKVRIPVVSTLKVDPYVGMQVGYVKDKVFNKEKFLGGGVVGVDILYFVSGVHFGVSTGYSVYTDDRFNYLRVGFVIGF